MHATLATIARTLRSRGGALAAAATFAAALAAPAPAGAQASATTTASCVGAALGCEQADIFFTLTSGAPLNLSNFSITLTTAEFLFSFPTFLEAEDVFGLIIANGTLSADRRTFSGSFAPTEATLDPTLRLRAAFDVFGADVSTLGYEFTGSDAAGNPLLRVSSGPTAVIPEPSTVLLVGGGLALAGLVTRVRRA